MFLYETKRAEKETDQFVKGGAEIYIQGVYIYAYVVHYVCMNIMFEVVLWNVRRSFNGHLTSKCCGNKVRDSLPKY